jgi:hypothetical protein
MARVDRAEVPMPAESIWMYCKEMRRHLKPVLLFGWMLLSDLNEFIQAFP